MRFVITGALGHIGSALARKLPELFDRCEVIMIDNMQGQRYCSLFDLPKTATYRFIEGDIRSMDLAPLLSGVDVVVHLAAITDAASSFDKADYVRQNNLECTHAVARACRDAGIPVIFPSSTSVYGVQEGEVDETCPREELKPQSPYAVSKLEEEDALAAMSRNEGLEVAICRFGTIFGISSGMRFHTAVNKFCWQAAHGLPVTVWRTAYNQYRPYLDLSDAISAIAFITKNRVYSPEVLNVVTKNYTVQEVVDAIRVHVPSLDVRFVDHAIMNQLSYKVRNARLLQLGFKTHGDLDTAISDTMGLLRQSNSLSAA